MLEQLEQWIDMTNCEHREHRTCCSLFSNEFMGFYPEAFLQNAYFVVVDTIPKPNLPGLLEIGLGDFIEMDVQGITYKNTYYVVPQLASNLRLHFHELVHVAQWKQLGTLPFIERYMTEIQTFGYDHSPLEKMAYGLDAHFTNGGKKIDVPSYVSQRI
jgi:hypothetical protein